MNVYEYETDDGASSRVEPELDATEYEEDLAIQAHSLRVPPVSLIQTGSVTVAAALSARGATASACDASTAGADA